jgi:hypothetical protein
MQCVLHAAGAVHATARGEQYMYAVPLKSPWAPVSAPPYLSAVEAEHESRAHRPREQVTCFNDYAVLEDAETVSARSRGSWRSAASGRCRRARASTSLQVSVRARMGLELEALEQPRLVGAMEVQSLVSSFLGAAPTPAPNTST